MAVGKYIKNAGLAALGLVSSAVPVFAQTVSELGQEQQINLPPFPDVSQGLAWVLNLPEPTTENLIYLKFILFLLFAIIFVHLALTVFKDNKWLAGVVGLIFALLGIKLTPNEPLLIFASSLGTTPSTAAIAALPILVIYFTYTVVKENDHKWKWLGVVAMGMGAIQIYSTAILGFFSASPIFSYGLGIALIVAGIIMFFLKFRVPVIAAVSEKASVALHGDLRSTLRSDLGITFRDAAGEFATTKAALAAASTLRSRINSLPSPISANKIKAQSKNLVNSVLKDRKLFGRLMADLNRDIAFFKSSVKNSAILVRLRAAETLVTTAETTEATALARAEWFNAFANGTPGAAQSKTALLGRADYIITQLEKEKAALYSVMHTINAVNSVIGK